MLVLHDPDTLLHETVELLGAKLIPALESPARIRGILSALENSNRHEVQHVHAHNAALVHLVGQTHAHDYLSHLSEVFQQWTSGGLIEDEDSILPECFVLNSKAISDPGPPKDIYARAGYYAFDMSSGIMKDSYASILASANLAVEAVQQLREREAKEVFALCRPPGHHCDGRKAGGYCYVNNAAVAVTAWRAQSPDCKVGILDLDFHHGNGTQEIFYSDPKTFYASIHGHNEFPYYTGKEDEQGDGDAIGTNLNLPLESGSTFDQYLQKLEAALSALETFDLALLVVSLGFDTFTLDPLGSFKIDTADYETMARTVRQRIPNLPAVILQEGGYVIEHLGANLLSFLRGWESAN